MNATTQKILSLFLALIFLAGFQSSLRAEETRAELLAMLKSGTDGRQLVAIKRLMKEGTFDAELARALAGVLKDNSADVRRAAALGLERIGAPAKETVPALLELVKDKDSSVRSAVIAALGALGPPEKEALPALLEALKDPIPQLRVAAVEAIRRYGPGLNDSAETRAALSELGVLEKHPDVVNALVVCLAEIEPVSVELVPFFAAGLRGGLAARVKSVEALNKIGPAAAPALLPSLSSDNILVRREVAAMFESFMKKKDAPASLRSPEIALALAGLLKDQDGISRKFAVAALASMGRDALPAAPELLKRLSENDYLLRVSAAGVLENLGVPVPEAVPALLEMMQDKNHATRVAASKALAKQGSEQALNGALALLKSPRDEVRTTAIMALGLFGPVAERGLAQALKSERSEEQLAALAALDRIGGARAEALPELTNLLKSHSSNTRIAVMASLARSGAAAVPPMMTALASIDKLGTINQPNDFQLAVEDAFGKIGAPAVPALIALIQERSDDPARNMQRVVAMNALGKIGPAASAAIGALIAELEPVQSLSTTAVVPVSKKALAVAPSTPTVSARAREDAAALFALGGIGRAAEAALPLMFEMMKDGEPLVRFEAGRAISKIATGKERIPPLTEIVERCDATSISFALRPFQDDGLRALLAEFEPTNLQTRQRVSSVFSNVTGVSLIQFLTSELKMATEPKMRMGAAYVLGEMRHLKRSATPTSTSTALDAALPALRSAIDDPDPDVCVLAAYACAKNTDSDDPELISKIANALAHCLPDNRSRGIVALSNYNLEKLGRKASPALGVLIRAASIDTSAPGASAKAMLHQIGQSKEDVPVLVELLKDKSIATRKTIMKLLEAIGPDAVAATPALIEGLNDDDKLAQRSFEAVLLAIGSEAVPYLIEAMKNTPPLEGKAAKQIRRTGAAQVLTLMKLDGEWLQRVADLLVENRPEVRANAMVVLSAGAERAKYALPHLKQLLADDDKLVNRVGLDLVSLMGAEAVPELVALAKDARPHIRSRVAAGLKPAPGTAPTPEAMAALLELLKDDTSEVKAAALTSLASIKGNDAEIIKELPAALRDESSTTRRAAVAYLKAHGAGAPKETIGCLAFVLKDKNADAKLKTAAIEALRELSPNDLAIKVTVAIPVADPLNEVKNPNPANDAAQFELPKAPVEVPPPDVGAAALKPEITKDVVVSIESILLDALGDADRKVRAGAADAVAHFALDSDPAKKVLINQMFAYDALELYAYAQEEYFIKAWDDQRVHYYAASLKELPTLPSSMIAAQKFPPGLANEEAKPDDKASAVPASYKGYWFKLLESQGAGAVGGAKKFIIEGKFSQGHALAAFPEEYGKTGRCVIIVGDDGTIYKKDLGPETAAYCAGLRELNPDATWEKTKVRPKEEQTIRFHTPDPDSVPLEF